MNILTVGLICLKKYICVKQHDEKDCGVACLATIAQQYGLRIPISKIREMAGNDKQGTSAYGLIKVQKNILINVFITSMLIFIAWLLQSCNKFANEFF